ncbi:HdeD family acid-resistance protein [Yinghuangia sp. YIM S09857]|uniref:HdeD family acid-resistance protein n=1 Tax=Yinghuangia sp. YIM S09857 TaxID=3436929 RepID=UPI003F531CFB
MDIEPTPTLDGIWRELARTAWQAVFVTGLLSLALGIIVLVWPGPSLRVVGVLFGLYLLISGVFQLVSAFGTHTTTGIRVMAFISGALSILLGLFCFRGTLQSIFLLGLWIGIGWLFRGIAEAMAAASAPDMPGRGWHGFLGAVTAIAGVVLVVSPFESVKVLTVVVGCWLIAVGIVEIVTSFRIRREGHQVAAEWSARGAGARVE